MQVAQKEWANNGHEPALGIAAIRSLSETHVAGAGGGAKQATARPGEMKLSRWRSKAKSPLERPRKDIVYKTKPFRVMLRFRIGK